jgi:hypothetical protein
MFTTYISTASSSWFRVVVRSLIRPCAGRDFDGRTSITSHSGDLQGIAGRSLLEIDGLELPRLGGPFADAAE